MGRMGCNWSLWQQGTGLVEHAAYESVCCVYVVTVQGTLMSEVGRARAAVDADVGVVGVAEPWLRFLRNIAAEKANRVRC